MHFLHEAEVIVVVYDVLLLRFMEPSIIVVLGGILPFGSIFIEMYAYEAVHLLTQLHILY